MFDFVARLHWRLSKAREFPGLHRLLDELDVEDTLSTSVWRHQCIRRLERLLTFARDHVPYYRHLFRRHGFDPANAELPDDLARVPLLTKTLVRERLDDLLADRSERSEVFKNATGGSTGVPLTFYQDQRYWAVAEAIDAHVRRWWAIKPYDRTALIWGADREFKELSFKQRFYEWRQRRRSLNAFRMDRQGLLDFCRMLARWRPPYLMGYASALEALALSIRDNRVEGLRFRAIRSAAEMLWPEQRRLIEEVFHSPVYNFYGSREINNLAAECPEHHRLHLISTWRYVEIVDEAGRPLPDGTPGRIAVTDLSNYAMPMVRYCNEDVGAFACEPCPCGRPSPVLERLLGRSSDLIRTPAGEIVHGEYFTHLFYGRDEIAQFTVHQTSLDHLVVRYVPAAAGHQTAVQEAVEEIRRRMGRGVTVDVQVCEEIPLPPSGKYRFTLSDVS